jgi:hypothetical protein
MPFLRHGINGAPAGDLEQAVRSTLGSGVERNAQEELEVLPMSPRLTRLANQLVRDAEDRSQASYAESYNSAAERREARPRMFLKHGVMEGQDVDTDNSHELGGHGVSAEWVRSKIRAADVAPERAHKALQTAAKKLSHADRRLMRDDSDENVRAYVKRNAQVVALENKRGAR